MSTWPINNEVLADISRDVREGKPLPVADQTWLAGACEKLSTALDNANEAIEDIRLLMDGKEWSPDTLEAIATIMRGLGLEIRDPEDTP